MFVLKIRGNPKMTIKSIMKLAAITLLAAIVGIACSSEKAPQRPVKDIDHCEKEENKTKKDCVPPTGTAEEIGEGDAKKSPTIDLQKNFLEGVKPFSDEEAISYVKNSCGGCHESKSGSVRSFWSLELEGLDKKALSTDSLAHKIYYTTYVRARDLDIGKPAPMPPQKLKGAKLDEHLRFVKWAQQEMPGAVAQANNEFAKGLTKDGNNVGVLVNYKCEEPATFRSYIRRVTNDLFSREPTAEELKLNGTTPEDLTTVADRAKISSRIFENTAWKKEFVDIGLKKFADKLSGANAIEPLENAITADQAKDLKQEFYQILKKNFDDKSFKDILLSNKVMVSPNTASLYDCTPPASGWKECDLPAGRASYFTSLSYLASKKSSFLQENNNYGRAATLYFFIRGDVFKPSFANDAGGETTKPLPKCLKSNDYRGIKTGTAIAPMGTNAIPASGNLCQSCHIDRQMATGSIVFRKFNPVGLIYELETPLASDPDYAAAKDVNHIVNRPDKTTDGVAITDQFLEDLMNGEGEQGCIPGEGGEKDVIVKDVKDLATWMIGDGSVLANGVSRHIPRAISNLSNTSEEIILKMNKAYTQSEGKLDALFKAYISSETYSCKR
jgi:hypothetical protein